MTEPVVTSFTVPARDEFQLHATLIEAAGTAKGCIQINSATGAKKEIYLNLSKYLATNGYHTLIFDYRGIGGSKPKSLRGFHALTQDWGKKDMSGALDWLHAKYPHLKKFIIGHSAGGQQLGLMDNHHLISAAYLVSCSTGYWKWLRSPYKYFTLAIWYVLTPLFATTVGYLPATWFKLGEDLPKGVALEWRTWCLKKDYFGSFLGKTLNPHYFNKIVFPIHFVYPEDDNIATDRTVESLRSFYSNSQTTVEKLELKSVGMKSIGHFGFFSRMSKDKLWGKVVPYFERSPG